MIINYGIEAAESPLKGRAVSVGVFDGVHLGHQKIFRRLVDEARRMGLEAVAVTFDPHPLTILSPLRSPKLLCTLDERLAYLVGLGLDRAVVLPFDRYWAELSACDFVSRVLVGELKVKALFEGPNFSFGKGGIGDCRYLETAGREFGFTVEVLDPAVVDGETVSSSRIRRALSAGRIDEANRCLGRPYALSGAVAHGDGRGRELGFPTANLEIDSRRVIPLRGVYAVWAEIPGCYHRLPAVINIGCRPTFPGRPAAIEVHLIDWSGDLYGRTLAVSFLKRLRDETKFDSPSELGAQLEKDCYQARQAAVYFASHSW